MIKTSTRDREALMKFLEQETGAPAQYLGAPTFAYQIGAYKLLRNADIDCISPPDESFLQHLRESGFLENAITAEGIGIPFTTADPKSRMNLICMLSMRAKLINKAIGQDNVFIVRKGFLQKLKDHNPATLDEFRAEMAHLDAGRNLRGIHFLDDRVIFTGFPDTASDAEQQAFRDLATCMVRSSEAQRWVKAVSDDIVNEKYAFRVFLVKIGMKGKEYDMTREILIERLSADSTYRLPEQKLQFEEKRRIEGEPMSESTRMTSLSSDGVRVIPRSTNSATHRIRVAVYCRVSTKSEIQGDSLENQIAHYKETVAADPRYELVEIYHDFGISGFKETRPGFQRMLEDGRAGKFALIITKSITRFARNTGIVLEAARELKTLGIGIFFELQNINTLSEGGELLMTLYAAFGQAESEANRVGAKMTIDRKIREGIAIKQLHRVHGYSKNAAGEIVPDEYAPIILMIYEMAAEGFKVAEITNYLSSEGIATKNGAKFSRTTVTRILQNEEYKGDFVQMKHYVDDHRKLRKNSGEVAKYYHHEDHVPIVTEELWEKAQRALNVRKQPKMKPEKSIRCTEENFPYKDNVFCAKCGWKLTHVYSGGRNQWECSGKRRFRTSFCSGVIVPDQLLRAWSPFTENHYISEERDRGRVTGFSFQIEVEWKESNSIKPHVQALPSITEETYPYKDRIFCKYCGGKLRRIAGNTGRIWWVCNTMSRKGKKACPGIRVPDEKLQALRNTTRIVYIGKEIIDGEERYGYTGKPDQRKA